MSLVDNVLQNKESVEMYLRINQVKNPEKMAFGIVVF